MASINSYVLAVLSLLLLCICFGKSVPIDNSSIANSLSSLASTCTNPLLSSQINAKILDCKTLNSQRKQDKFDCLLFYDINKQLCQDSAIVVNEDAIGKLNTSVNIAEVCTSAMTWNISYLEEYPHYKPTLDHLLKTTVSCVALCKVDDIEIPDANFYCKYYKWGVDLLRNKEKISKTIDNSPANIVPETSAIISSKTVITSGSESISNTASQTNSGITVLEAKPIPSNITMIADKNMVKTGIKTTTLNHVSDINTDADIKVKVPSETVPLPPLLPNKELVNQVAEKPEPQIDDNVPLVDPVKEKDGNSFGDGNRPSYNDDDTEYNNMEGFEQPNAAPPSPNKKQIVESGLSFNGEILPQKELVTHTFPDGYGEENDNFFPVFLTGIIMVVLLYILYHNKSRVSKVVLGLIVEGRQSNRRRNSRGHAYRRLDTLEQAMNTNQSAAPSKIIY